MRWDLNPATRAGALRAARAASYACFPIALLMVLWLTVTAQGMLVGEITPVSWLFRLAEFTALIVAGFRLRRGKGMVSGGIAAALMAIELFYLKLAGIILYIVVLTFLANGLHGVWVADRRGVEELEETFL